MLLNIVAQCWGSIWPPLAEEFHVVTRRKVTLYFFTALALAGAYDALRNLPVLSGCNFYAECPKAPAERLASDPAGQD